MDDVHPPAPQMISFRHEFGTVKLAGIVSALCMIAAMGAICGQTGTLLGVASGLVMAVAAYLNGYAACEAKVMLGQSP